MLDSAPFLSELAGWVEWLHEPTANYVRQLDSWAKLSWEAAAGFISELGESDKAASAEGHGKAPFVTGGVLWGPVLFLSSPETIGRRSIRQSPQEGRGHHCGDGQRDE
jgi:hypothetical protein